MLSTENPPQDPQFSGLKSSCNEKASDNKLETVDLLISDLDENDHALPKFSIREYVFCARNKDISKNWPFSQKNLELCFKHGVRELLPPFQSADAVRKPPTDEFDVQTNLIENKNERNSCGKSSILSDHFGDVDLCLSCSTENPSVSVADKEFRSTTTSLSCSNIDSVPTNKGPFLEQEGSTLQKPSVDTSEAVIQPAFKKRESINQSTVKRGRLIVKSSNIPRPSTREDCAANTSLASEAMAVCPVCRVFSSSSNTTLNAHMDQCLAGESTTKWMENSKLIKHRIKPRKMKLMVDIYKTAPYCTVEELERRNGTNWATNLCAPAEEEIEMAADQNKQLLSLNLEETREGPVYIDANGTKLRILSKFDDLSLDSKDLDGPVPRKRSKGDGGSKLLPEKKTKKKKQKNRTQKQHNVLKHSPSGRKESSEINNCQERSTSSHKETNARDEHMTKSLKDHDQPKFSKTKPLRGWVCSKRTGPTTKVNATVDHPHSGESVDGNLPTKRGSPSAGNVNRNSILRFSDEYTPYATQRIEMSPCELPGEYADQPSLRKRMRLSMSESPVCHDRKKSLATDMLAEHGGNKLRKDGTSHKKYVPSLNQRRIAIRFGPDRRSNHLAINEKLSTSHNSLLSGTKLLSLRKKVQSESNAAAANSQFYLNSKSSATKKSRVFPLSKSNKEVGRSPSRVRRLHDFMRNPAKRHTRKEKIWCQESRCASFVPGFRRGKGWISTNKEEAVMKNSKSTPLSGDSDGTSLLGGDLSTASDALMSSEDSIDTDRGEVDIEQLSSEVEVGGLPLVCSSNSLNPGFNALAAQIDAQCHLQRSVEEFQEALYETEAPVPSREPILTAEAGVFCATITPENMMVGNVPMMVEVDSSEGQGNYFAEIDPIPIPGPPGSFLPSPGRMDSDDYQRNASLSSSRFQYSAEIQELVDYSSASPASATSTVSASTLTRPGSKPSERLAVGLPVPDTVVASSDFIVEECLPVPKSNKSGAEVLSVYGLKGDRSTVSEIRPLRFETDHECCCSRREGLLHNAALNFQESQLLKRRSMASTLLCSSGKMINSDLNKGLDNVKSSLSVKSPLPVEDDATLAGQKPSRDPVNTLVRFPGGVDYDSAVPPSTPVLRLMGKNLMIIKKDENGSPVLKPIQPSSTDGCANPRAGTGVPSESPQDLVPYKVPCLVTQGGCLNNQSETHDGHPRESDVRWSNGVPQMMSVIMNPTVLPAQSADRNLNGCLYHPEPSGREFFQNANVQPIIKYGTPWTYNVDKFAESPSRRWKGADYTQTK